MYNFHLLLLGLTVTSNTLLIYILYRYSHKELTAIVTLIVLLISINTWVLPKFIINAFFTEGAVFETLSRISAIGYISVPVAFLLFSLSYTLKTDPFKKFKFWLFLVLPALIFLYLSWTSNLIGVHDYGAATLYSWGYETPAGSLYSLFVFWFVGICLLAYFILIRHYYSVKDSLKKKQIAFVLMSVILPLVLGTITNGLLPLLNIFVVPTGLALSLTSLMSVIIVYAIFKYGLFMISPMTVLSNINHSIITVDIKGNIMQMNEYAEHTLRVEESDVADSPLKDYMHVQLSKKDQENKLREILNNVIREGRSITYDTYSRNAFEKDLTPFTISITPIYSEKNLVGANIFLLDKSGSKRRVKEKEDYLAILSHELKTPVTTLQMYNQLLSKNLQNDDENTKLIDKMAHQISRINKLTKDFYELSRLHIDNSMIDREYFGIDDFVHSIVENMQITYKECEMSVDGTTNCVVFADKDKIEQVLINLINNAIKYSHKDKKVKVILSSDENMAVIGVKDYGIGIKSELQDKIFERFYQIKEDAIDKSGLGIGLFIASTIVNIHHGEVWVESEEGEGSTFYFSLPVSKRGGGEFNINSKSFDLNFS